jgi:hypothetical protein
VTQSNIADGTVRHETLSVSNADSTLQIFKERQPIGLGRWRKHISVLASANATFHSVGGG